MPKEMVLAAIQDSGAITLTVAKRLSCDWLTARKLIERWEETKNAFKAEGEKLLDVAEGQVIKAVYNGDLQTAKWLLVKKGKERGYGDEPDLYGTPQNPLNIQFSENITKEALQASEMVEIGNAQEAES